MQKENVKITHDYSDETNIVSNMLLRVLLIIAGTISLGLGIIGIVVPILPTTPFLLLAAACYSKSSNRFYNWLMNNRWFGKYIRNYREGKGIPLKMKIYTTVLLWATILVSSIFFVDILFVRIILILIAIAVSIHILHIKTLK